MLPRIVPTLSQKSVPEMLSAVAVVLNREISPVLRAVRDAINRQHDDTYVPMGSAASRPTAGTGTSFAEVDALLTSANPQSVLFDPSDYPETQNGRARYVYFEVVGYMGSPGAATSVEFELYNDTDSASVSTVLTTASASPVKALAGPFTVGTDLPDEQKRYVIRSKRTGGTTEEALLVSGAFVVRYL